MTWVNITINGREIAAPAGITILQAARKAGIDIPTLCNHPALSAVGACRICIVDVKGQRALQTACTFPVSDGMEIETESPVVVTARKLVLEMLFAERNHFCPYCEMSGNCELQELGYRYGIDHFLFPAYSKSFPLDATNKYYLMDNNRCVLCGRCARGCAELVANHTLGLRQRGNESMIHADANLPLALSSCISCGTCVQLCPTGALFYKRSAFMGSASLTKKTKSSCIQCSVGCGTEIITRGGNVLQILGDWDAAVNCGLMCEKGRFQPLYETRSRITSPLLRKKHKTEKVSWTKALQAAARKISGVKADEIGVLVSGFATNEAWYLINKLFREELKVSNIGLTGGAAPRIPNQSFAGLKEIAASDIVLVVCAEPVKNQPVVSFMIKAAVDKGARLIVVDDRENGLDAFAYMKLKTVEMEKALEIINRARTPIILYGAEINQDVTNEMKKFSGKAGFIGIDSVAGACAAHALGIKNEFNPASMKLLYVLEGEQNSVEKDLLKNTPPDAVIIVQASYSSELVNKADIILPQSIWAEIKGSMTNTEGNVLKINNAVKTMGEAMSDWEVLQKLAGKLRKNIAFSPDDVPVRMENLLKGKEL